MYIYIMRTRCAGTAAWKKRRVRVLLYGKVKRFFSLSIRAWRVIYVYYLVVETDDDNDGVHVGCKNFRKKNIL